MNVDDQKLINLVTKPHNKFINSKIKSGCIYNESWFEKISKYEI